MYLWMFILPLLLLFACWGWLFLSRRWNWLLPVTEDQTNSDQESSDLQDHSNGSVIPEDQKPSENWSDLLFRSRWLFGLLIALLLLVVFAFYSRFKMRDRS